MIRTGTATDRASAYAYRRVVTTLSPTRALVWPVGVPNRVRISCSVVWPSMKLAGSGRPKSAPRRQAPARTTARIPTRAERRGVMAAAPRYSERRARVNGLRTLLLLLHEDVLG